MDALPFPDRLGNRLRQPARPVDLTHAHLRPSHRRRRQRLRGGVDHVALPALSRRERVAVDRHGSACRRGGRRAHPGWRSRLARRLDPEAATGLALTLALLVSSRAAWCSPCWRTSCAGTPTCPARRQRRAVGDRHATASFDGRPPARHRPRRADGRGRHGGDPRRSSRRSGRGAAGSPRSSCRRRAATGSLRRRSRTSPTGSRPDAQPGRGDARAVLPERPLVVVGRVLRRRRAAARHAARRGRRAR